MKQNGYYLENGGKRTYIELQPYIAEPQSNQQEFSYYVEQNGKIKSINTFKFTKGKRLTQKPKRKRRSVSRRTPLSSERNPTSETDFQTLAQDPFEDFMIDYADHSVLFEDIIPDNYQLHRLYCNVILAAPDLQSDTPNVFVMRDYVFKNDEIDVNMVYRF